MGDTADRLRAVAADNDRIAPLTLVSLQADGIARYATGTAAAGRNGTITAELVERFSDRAGPFGSQPFFAEATDSGTLAVDATALTAQLVLHAWDDRSVDLAFTDAADALVAVGPAAGGAGDARFVLVAGAPQTLPDLLHDRVNIAFDSQNPVGGWAEVTLHHDGSWNFSGNLHDSGALSYDVAVAWVLRSGSGTAYSFTTTGHLAGLDESGSRDAQWDRSGANPAIRADWRALVATHESRVRTAANLNVSPLVDDAVTALGAVAAVVAVC